MFFSSRRSTTVEIFWGMWSAREDVVSSQRIGVQNTVYRLTESVIGSTKEVATDSSDVVGLRRMGDSIERVEEETLLA